MQAQRSVGDLGDHDGRTALWGDADDLAVDKAGPDLAVTVDDDVLGRIAGHGDDGQIRRRKIRKRIDRRRRPADGVDRRLTRCGRHRSTVTAVSESPAGFGEHAVKDFVDRVELLLPADQRRRQLNDRVSAVIGAAVQACLEERGSQEAAQQPLALLVVEGLLGGSCP